MTAVLGGTVLAFRLIGVGRHASDSSAVYSNNHVKPAHFDPDAFDTVGRRG